MDNPIPVYTSPAGEKEVNLAYQAILDRWPAPFQERMIPTTFGETHVIASGPADGPAVVLLHAFFATAGSWYRLAVPLSRRYRVLAVDVIGEANKSRPTRPCKSPADFLGWFTETLDGLGVDRFFLVGNSFGGFMSTYYAMHLAGRLRKLALISPASTFTGMPAFFTHMFLPKALYSFFPKLPGLERSTRSGLTWMYAGLPGDPLFDRLFYLSMVHGLAINQVFPRVYPREELAGIQAGTLLLIGDHEKIYKPEKAAQAARRLLPGIEVETIPGAHHIAAIAQPELVGERLIRFFSEGNG